MILQALVSALIIDAGMMQKDAVLLLPRENAASIADRYEAVSMPSPDAVEYVFRDVPQEWLEAFYADGGVIVYTEDIPQLKVGTMGVFYPDEVRILAATPEAMVHELCHYAYRKGLVSDDGISDRWLERNGLPASYAGWELKEEAFCRAMTEQFLARNTDDGKH